VMAPSNPDASALDPGGTGLASASLRRAMHEGLRTRAARDVEPREHSPVAAQKHEAGAVSHEGVSGLWESVQKPSLDRVRRSFPSLGALYSPPDPEMS
jgi:hypothetical protein